MRDFFPKFYRSSVMRFHLPLLYDVVASLRPSSSVCIGFGEGEGALTICQTLREEQIAGRCLIVHREENGEELSDEAWEKGRTFAKEFYPTEATCAVGRPTHFAEADEWPRVDLLLIDDCDSGAVLRDELLAWRGKLSSTAVVLLHGSGLERGDSMAVAWEEFSGAHPGVVFRDGIGLAMTFADEPSRLSPAARRFVEESARLIPVYRLAAAKIEAQHQASRLARQNAALRTRQTVLDSAREHWWRAQLVMDHQSRELAELQSRFTALLEDRQKAQEVMEAQAAHIAELELRKAEGLSAISRQQDDDDGAKRRSTPERIRRELARAWRRLGTPRPPKPNEGA